MRTLTIGMLAVAAALAGCATDGYGNGYGDGPDYSQYDYNRPDPSYGGYDAQRYYRDSPRYQERQLTENDRVYRGSDGRYYCRRNDGTTGLLIGAVAGGILGNIIAPGDSKTLGTVLGAGGGAVAGAAIGSSGNMRCR